MKMKKVPLVGVMVVVTIGLISTMAISAWAGGAGGQPMDSGRMHADMMNASGSTAHQHHMMAQEVRHSIEKYELPQVMLVREDGQQVSLAEELDDGKPVVMNFIFTSCTTVCPVSSRIFSVFQDELGSKRDTLHMVSISIDPEQDTPSVLKKYASKYGAGSGWHFYTGTEAASAATQRAFDVYRGDRMNHTPVTLMRAAPGQPWLRIDGFATAGELLHDYHELIATR